MIWKFNIHSIVDVIANSSTVIFTNATGSTIKSFKGLIDAVLNMSERNLIADDFFTFELLESDKDEDGGNTCLIVKVRNPEDSNAIIAKDIMEKLIYTYRIVVN